MAHFFQANAGAVELIDLEMRNAPARYRYVYSLAYLQRSPFVLPVLYSTTYDYDVSNN
jgi:hypothetical protein